MAWVTVSVVRFDLFPDSDGKTFDEAKSRRSSTQNCDEGVIA